MRNIFLIAFFCLSLLCGCASTGSKHFKRDPLLRLHNDIISVLKDSLFSSTHTSVKVVSLDDGKVLFDYNSKLLINPASNTKLLTSAAALSVLDTNYLFTTTVSADRYLSDGSMVNNLYLKGYGDPYLVETDLDSLTSMIKSSGVTAVLNNIVIDNSFFDSTYWGSGWMWDDESDPDNPYISPLSVNKNCIRISLFSDSVKTYMYLEPSTDYVTVINNAKVVKDTVKTPVTVKFSCYNNSNIITIDGELTGYSRLVKRLSLCNPQYYTGTLFKDCLQRAGIAVLGKVTVGAASDSYPVIARLDRPIQEIIYNMNKASDNLAAENILKVMSARLNGPPGTAQGGIYIVRKFLSDLGIDTTMCRIVDGSGVSRYNLLSSDVLIDLLVSVHRKPRIFDIIFNSLPVSGVDGTLSNRMKTSPAYSRVHAKTGNLSGVSCLSGYAFTSDGEMLAFSIMTQNFINSTRNIIKAQDNICNILAGFSRKDTSN